MVNELSSRFFVRFTEGGYAQLEGTYGGTGTYGDATLSYGSEAGESLLPGVRYVLVPLPTARPAASDWTFRVGDTSRPFRAAIVPFDDAPNRLDMDTVTTAYLILTRLVPFSGEMSRRSLLLDVVTADDEVRRDWTADDLATPGRYMAHVLLTFNSGRTLTLEPNDQLTIDIVAGGPT